MNEQNEKQPEPKFRPEMPHSWDLVKADIDDRDSAGRAKYGTPLQPCNGRDSLVDAYQEALDLVVYLRTEIEERRLALVGSENIIAKAAEWDKIVPVIDRLHAAASAHDMWARSAPALLEWACEYIEAH